MLVNELSEQQYKDIIISLQEQSEGYIRSELNSDRQVFKNLLKNLLGEIFKDKKSFLFELIQNADDQEATEANIILEQERLIFSHNSEHAFTKDDLTGISDAGRETKKEISNKIGQKGIGFKNVFKVTRYPRIFCGNLRFRFAHEDEYYRIIYPEWLDEPRKDDDLTHFMFDLDIQDVSYKLIREAVDQINPQTLLFLNHIRKIVIHDMVKGERTEFRKEILKIISGGCALVAIHVGEIQSRFNYHVFSKEIPIEEAMREYWERDNLPKISIAIPVNEQEGIIMDDASSSQSPDLYVYLPTKLRLGFRFILHGDFDTEVDRKDITDPTTNEFNNYMLRSVSDVFNIVIDYYRQDTVNRYRFLSLIPQKADNPNHQVFKIIQELLFERLKEMEIFPVDGYDNLFKKAQYIHHNVKDINKILGKDNFIKYYDESKDERLMLSSDITHPRSLELFQQLGGIKQDFGIILDILEHTAPLKPKDWFLCLYSFLNDYINKTPYLQRDEVEKKIANSRLILTSDNKIVDSTKAVFYKKDDIKCLDIQQLYPLYLHSVIDPNQDPDNADKQKLKSFLNNVFKIRLYDPNTYFKEYVSHWITEENIKKNEKDYDTVLKFIYESSSQIKFDNCQFFFADRNNQLLPHSKLYLGNEYRNEFHVETILSECGVIASYISNRYLDTLQGNVGDVRGFLLKIGILNIIPVNRDPATIKTTNYLPKGAEYVIPREEYHQWPEYVIRSQDIHECIFKVDNHKSYEFEMVINALNSPNPNGSFDEKAKLKITELLLNMLDKNWDSYYSKTLFCTIYYNQNKTKNTNWRTYNPKGYDISKLSDFGKLIKLRLKIPNSGGVYCSPNQLYLDNPLNKDGLIGIKIFSTSLIQFLNVQGTSSLSDLIGHLKSLKSSGEDPSNILEIYAEIAQKMKELKSNEQKNEYISELRDLLYLPQERRWRSVTESIFFDDPSGINYPYISSISSQLRLKGKQEELLKSFFVKQLSLEEHPPIESYIAIFDKFPNSLGESDIKTVDKLANYLINKDSSLLKGRKTISNNSKYLQIPETLYFLDIPVTHYSLDWITVNRRLSWLTQKDRNELGIRNISNALSIKEERELKRQEGFQEPLQQLQYLMFFIKEMMDSNDGKGFTETYNALKIRLVDQIVLKAPNDIEIFAYSYIDSESDTLFLNPTKIGNEELRKFAILYIYYLGSDSFDSLSADFDWLLCLFQESLPIDKIRALLKARKYVINFEKYTPIPILNIEMENIIHDPNAGDVNPPGGVNQVGIEVPIKPDIDYTSLGTRDITLIHKKKDSSGTTLTSDNNGNKSKGLFKIINTPFGTERISVSLILEKEKAEGFDARYLKKDEQEKYGCDIISEKSNNTRYIEIKGYSSGQKNLFQIQKSQYDAMQRYKDKYWIYLVRPNPFSVVKIQNPLKLRDDGDLSISQSPNYICELHGTFKEEYYDGI